MNKKQKVLTIVMMAVFVWFTVMAASIGMSEHEALTLCAIVWVTVGVIYAALFFVMAAKRK